MLPHSRLSLQIVIPLKNQIYSPILAHVTQDRWAGLIITGAVGLQAGLISLGLPGWQCPILHILGLPCPGCGLSRAMVALLHGDWRSSLELHAFAPIFVIALALIAGTTILPQKQRVWVMKQLEMVERRTGITAIVLIGLVFYWLVRLLIFPQAFINLVKG